MVLGVRVVLACLLAFGVGLPVGAVGSAAGASPMPLARPCSKGLVALTFDDGPAPGTTRRLVRILRERRVPATFFMVGSRVRSAPAAAQRVQRAGLAVANHTWTHPMLTRRPAAAIRSEVRRTARELRSHGIRPSPLMRPPYGSINPRVRGVLRGVGLVPVMWDVDSRDWQGGSARQIADSILRQLRPGRSNIVLQHDGIRNSPASVDAVPLVIRAARRRGYCFAELGPRGRMKVPVPTVTGEVRSGSETGPTPARVLITLSTPTSRRVSVRVSGSSGTATAGSDFVAPLLRVAFPVGTTRAWVDVPVLDDTAYEPTEDFRVVFDSPFGVVIARRTQVGSITSDDPASVVRATP